MERSPRRRSIQVKLTALVIGSILAVAIGLMLISYYFFCQRADERYRRQIQNAVVAASLNAEPPVLKNFWNQINTDEFRTLQAEARAANDEERIKAWLRAQPSIDAHARITRENSPIENVVLDLSNNTGGMVDAAVVVLSWFLGDAPFSVKNMATGAMSTSVYRADINLDHEFDERDTVADKKLFCLVSPVSFSCGNLVPAALKSSQKVTLIGRTTGGGSCVVQPMTTAYGTVFQISAALRMSFLKNGSFYDIDQGVEPDYYINDIANYYDRAALTDFINALF